MMTLYTSCIPTPSPIFFEKIHVKRQSVMTFDLDKKAFEITTDKKKNKLN